ncbi:MAG: amidohydrolase [Saprospiraceae bacterium]|nr:amidohydrolase [Saprospiraceae bacterium]
MSDLRISLVQSDLIWQDPEANRERLGEKAGKLGGKTDLIVLPEMFTTGFSMQTKELAESMDGPTVRWCRQLAAETGAVVTGSFICREGRSHFNRLLWMSPDGAFLSYDKRHLFTLAGEHHHYDAGRKRQLCQINGWKVLPLICYDLRFPVWSRNTDDYDLLLYVANWPEARSAAWRTLLRARAIENQAYTAGVNRVGNDGKNISYAGESCLIDYAGNIRSQVAREETVITLSLSREKMMAFRKKYRFLADRDRFEIEG